MQRLRVPAIVLSAMDFGDADRIVHVLTEPEGRLAAFAKNARKSKKRFAGGLEPFMVLEVELVETRGDMYRLDSARLVDAFAELRDDLGRLARAAYACELVRELCREKEPHPDVFALLRRLLQALARERAGALVLLRFELLLLGMAGLAPQLEACIRCGAPSGPDDAFDPEAGGVVCRACGGQPAPDAVAGTVALRAIARAAPGTTLELEAHARAEARNLLNRFVAHHVGKRLKSLDFMRDMGVE